MRAGKLLLYTEWWRNIYPQQIPGNVPIMESRHRMGELTLGSSSP